MFFGFDLKNPASMYILWIDDPFWIQKKKLNLESPPPPPKKTHTLVK